MNNDRCHRNYLEKIFTVVRGNDIEGNVNNIQKSKIV